MIRANCSFRSLSESNMFLRALWASMRRRFGVVGWQYTPHRDGKTQRIRFGWATLGAASPDRVEISVRYRQRGIVSAVEFEPSGAIRDRYPTLEADLRACVDEALQIYGAPKDYCLLACIGSSAGERFASYSGARWWISPNDEGSSTCGLVVHAFDEADAKHEFALRLGCFLDCLAVWTNRSFLQLTQTTPGQALDREQSEYWSDAEWLEGYPIEGGLLRLLPSQIAILDSVVEGGLGLTAQITHAARHFHEGLALHLAAPGRFPELATVLMVSAIETITSGDGDRSHCKSCGQPIYKISQRVIDLAVRHLGLGVERIFRDHYGARSRFLHMGALSASQPYTGALIPQLDPDAPQDSAMPRVVSQPINLIEFTSFLLRQETTAKTRVG